MINGRRPEKERKSGEFFLTKRSRCAMISEQSRDAQIKLARVVELPDSLEFRFYVSSSGRAVQVPPRAPSALNSKEFRAFFYSKVRKTPVFPHLVLQSWTLDFFVDQNGGLFMRRTMIQNVADVQRITVQEATKRFIRHCKVRNLKPETLKYYAEDCGYFSAHIEVEFIDEVNAEVLEQFIFQEMEAGKKVTSINTRIRGLRVFFNFCAERDYMTGFKFPLLKEDKTIKEPYTDSELVRATCPAP